MLAPNCAAAPRQKSIVAWSILLVLCTLTVLVYWPSLFGGFLFDDRALLENSDLHVTTLHLADWVRAALADAGTRQFRALGMLSFAGNYYLTGTDPFWFKFTNVGIHLLNGLVLFLMLRELFRACFRVQQRNADRSRVEIAAALMAGAWLLLPINLTAVAYISQRLESLANVFVLLGLFWYVRVRTRLYSGQSGTATLWLWLGLVLCTALGYGAKESGLMLPLYTACIEFAIFRFRNRDGAFSRPALTIHAALLVLPFLVGLLWLMHWVPEVSASHREFSIGERLLTESRVLVDYIVWTMTPNLNLLTFYHDDLAISHGLLDPPTTLYAIVALLCMLATAIWQRRSRPLLCLGILWFFAGHALTATVIPLELVFEHRNYFPSAGLVLAAASLLALEPGIARPFAKLTVAGGFIVFFALTTYLRAEEWSHPLRLAYSEALKRPDSERAQYELARTLLLVAGENQHSPLLGESVKILEKNALLPQSGIAALQALIFVNARAHRPIDPKWWQTMIERLHEHTPSQTDVSAIIFLFHCQTRTDCQKQTQEMLDVFTAALEKSHGDVNLMSAYAEFVFRQLGDIRLSERMFRDVVEAKPQVPVYRANLARMLIASHQLDAAEKAIAELESLNHLGSLDVMIAELRSAVSAARLQASPPLPQLPIAQ